MRISAVLLSATCCCLLACQGPIDSADDGAGQVSFTLRANADGDLERCDADGACETVPNPDRCNTLEVSVDTASGATCESCRDDAGAALYERCGPSPIACTVVTIPDPDCVVCAHVEGAILFSNCIAEEADECSEEKCGPLRDCPVYECWDGSMGGCTDECYLDPQTNECSRFHPCPPKPEECTPEECGPPPMCPAYLCWDGSTAGCTGICERGEDGRCGYVIAECPPKPTCEDVECGRAPCPAEQCEDGTWTTSCTCEFDPRADGCRWTPDFETCEGPVPTCEPADCGKSMCPTKECPDGTTTTECTCEPDSTGACRWRPIDTCSDECATDADCPKGSHCEGSSVCPPDVDCFWEGIPGHCVEDPAPCGLDECGPPPPCGAPLECNDGSIVGCACERAPDSGVCGWTYQACPDLCGDVACGPGYKCCNAAESQCVPEEAMVLCRE